MKKHSLILITVFLLLTPQRINAQQLIRSFVDWDLFRIDQGVRQICYIAAIPVKKDGTYNRRGEPYFLVINFDNYDEISIASGDYYRPGSQAEISFGLRKFSLFTHKSLSWANERADDIEIIKEMRRNQDMVVSGILSDGSFASDTYSLVSFVEAYDKMHSLCNHDDNSSINLIDKYLKEKF